jgi:RND family efflux transporter MFP subunit
MTAGFTMLALLAGFYFGTKHDFHPREQSHDGVEKINLTTIRVYKDTLENIKTMKIVVMDFPEKLNLSGKIGITEDRTTVIPSRVAGRIENIYFASGEMVAKGQLLATLFSPDFVASKEEFIQALRQSKNASNKNDDFSDLAKLARKKLETLGLTNQDINAIANHPDSKSSPLLNLRATRNGFIIAKGAVLGNSVNVGDTLFTIGDMDKVWFTGDLYPEDLPKVHKGQVVSISVTGSEKPLMGQVSFISPMVDATSRSIKIRALVENPHGELKADMYVQGSVTLSQRKALLVPTIAVVRTPEGDILFKKLNKSNLETSVASLDFKKTPVKLGSEQNGMVPVLEGLGDGDEVVSDGAWLLESALNSTESSK